MNRNIDPVPTAFFSGVYKIYFKIYEGTKSSFIGITKSKLLEKLKKYSNYNKLSTALSKTLLEKILRLLKLTVLRLFQNKIICLTLQCSIHGTNSVWNFFNMYIPNYHQNF